MCGILGIIDKKEINYKHLKWLAKCAKQRGMDSSGIIFLDQNDKSYKVKKENFDICKLLRKNKFISTNFIMGHSRLITDGLQDNQPVIRESLAVLHNGIIVNANEIWGNLNQERKFLIDTEVILGIVLQELAEKENIKNLPRKILTKTRGTLSCALLLAEYGKLILVSNNGSLYIGNLKTSTLIASERFSLEKLGCNKIEQINEQGYFIDIPKIGNIKDDITKKRKINIIPSLQKIKSEEKLLKYKKHNLLRCKKCILPETMPYIEFDNSGICNYCNNYKLKNVPKDQKHIFDLVKPYRKNSGAECIVPFSGGRDSSYTLHLIVEELKLKPITYTYDWGMVTDLARRNISRMCSKLKVENIIVSANITRKRENIKKNLNAWLNSPHLGLISILTAGDKHFYRHTETIKKQTGINLNIWGICPIETTHFKAGFLGVPPDFCAEKVYMSGWRKQFDYQKKRFKAMIKSPGHFNSSLFDTLWGEYGRSLNEKKDYFHIFDYWRWDEKNIEKTILNNYDWEIACDTKSTWRIGDGTAAFYNYLYYTIAGFTEHDTFRSNQIRENQLTREEALLLINEENRPRYQNIRWYLDTLNLDYESVIKRINSMKTLY